MTIHIVEGIAGCHLARELNATAVIVDALRASCTASMLFHAGALAITLVSDVPSALAFKHAYPDSLLFGERHGLPPEGFDYGNSPRTVEAARNHSIAFTTSNGTALMLEAWGAPEVLMASTTNAGALVQRIAHHERDVVLIPAGNVLDPEFSAQEDWVAATHIASMAGGGIGEGASVYREWASRIKEEGIYALFDSAPHAENLRAVDLAEDIAFCAQVDVSTVIPHATELTESGLRLERV
jgi:2-phosphosulfolactate phosphatase